MLKKSLLVLVSVLFTSVSVQATTYSFLPQFFSLLNLWSVHPWSQPLPKAPEVTTAPLALEEEPLIAFSTERLGEGALLKWDLPEPTAVVNLVIEGSHDGRHFVDLESLDDLEAGVLDIFYDATPQDRRFYRLIANYKDGEQKVTPIQVLTPVTAFSAVLDATKAGFVTGSGSGPVALYDLQGQLIATAYPVQGTYELELTGLPHGPYLVQSGMAKKVVFY